MDELVGADRHDALALGAVAATILVAQGHAALVEGDESLVRESQPKSMNRAQLLEAELPINWAEQEWMLGFAA